MLQDLSNHTTKRLIGVQTTRCQPRRAVVQYLLLPRFDPTSSSPVMLSFCSTFQQNIAAITQTSSRIQRQHAATHRRLTRIRIRSTQRQRLRKPLFVNAPDPAITPLNVLSVFRLHPLSASTCQVQYLLPPSIDPTSSSPVMLSFVPLSNKTSLLLLELPVASTPQHAATHRRLTRICVFELHSAVSCSAAALRECSRSSNTLNVLSVFSRFCPPSAPGRAVQYLLLRDRSHHHQYQLRSTCQQNIKQAYQTRPHLTTTRRHSPPSDLYTYSAHSVSAFRQVLSRECSRSAAITPLTVLSVFRPTPSKWTCRQYRLLDRSHFITNAQLLVYRPKHRCYYSNFQSHPNDNTPPPPPSDSDIADILRSTQRWSAFRCRSS